MKANVINDYHIVVSGNAFTAPELRYFYLVGEASWILPGRPRMLTSSPIVSVKGRVVITLSGSRYVLGKRAAGHMTFSQLRKKHPGVRL